MSRAVITALCGLAGSAGLLLFIRGLIPRSVPFAVAYERFHRPRTAPVVPETSDGGLIGDLGAMAGPPSLRLLERYGYDMSPRASDLRILHMTEARHAFRKLATMLAAATIALIGLWVIATVTGLPGALPLIGAVAAACGGFFIPDLDLKQRAAQARNDHVAALGAYLELARALIASGLSPEAAMSKAADTGTGAAFEEFQAASLAVITRKLALHRILDELGDTLQIDELRNLAGSLALASEKGASIEQALAAKATMITSAQRFKELGEANAANARMSGPLAMLGLTFTLFLGLPAVAALIQTSSSGF